MPRWAERPSDVQAEPCAAESRFEDRVVTTDAQPCNQDSSVFVPNRLGTSQHTTAKFRQACWRLINSLLARFTVVPIAWLRNG